MKERRLDDGPSLEKVQEISPPLVQDTAERYDPARDRYRSPGRCSRDDHRHQDDRDRSRRSFPPRDQHFAPPPPRGDNRGNYQRGAPDGGRDRYSGGGYYNDGTVIEITSYMYYKRALFSLGPRQQHPRDYHPMHLDVHGHMPPPNPPQQPPSAQIEPIMSFKKFMLTQHEDLPAEIFQKRYEEYNLDYLRYFSDSFFKASKGEEWFQDRYNPLNIVNMEKETSQWAKGEAERFKNQFLGNPQEFIAACSLEPNRRNSSINRRSTVAAPTPAPNTANDGLAALEVSPVVRTDASDAVGNAGDKITAATDTAVAPAATAVSTISEEFSGKHLSGHESRTVYISGVHACCPKKVLRSAIINSLSERTNGREDMKPDRILISQPVWSTRSLDKFERTAWVVMPSTASATSAVDLLRDLDVAVPVLAITPNGEVSMTTFGFKISSTLHMMRTGHTVPEMLSYSQRVAADLNRATFIANMCDEERDIPEENRLETILGDSKAVESVHRMVDHLDIVIAYLRRVHFITFYAARRYRDEAHLLSFAPTVPVRAMAFVPLPDEPAVYVMPTVTKKKSPDGEGGNNTNVPDDSLLEDGPAAEGESAANEEEQKRTDDDNAEENIRADDGPVAADESKGEEAKDPSSIEDKAEDADKEVNAATDGQASKSVETVTALTSVTRPARQPRFVQTVDRRIEPLIKDLKSRIRMKRTRERNPSLPGLPDEEDAKKLEALQEKSFAAVVESSYKTEPDGKCRCCYQDCKKLFKGMDFLLKHFKTKHEDAAADQMLLDAEPFMRRRFEAEDMMHRPLPPVEIECGGRIDLKSVKDILERYSNRGAMNLPPGVMSIPPAVVIGGPDYDRDRRRGNNNNDRDFRFRDNNNRDRDFRDNRGDFRRDSRGGGDRGFDGGNNNKRNRDSLDGQEKSPMPLAGDKMTLTVDAQPPRKVSAYRDIDAPKVSFATFFLML